MAKRHLLMLGLLLAGGALSTACSDMKLVSIGDAEAGAAGEAGAKGDAGSTSAGGAAEGGAGGEGGETPFEFPPSLNPQGVVVIGPAPSTFTRLLVGASDYVGGKAEIVSITLASGAVGDSTTYDDTDLATTSSAGVGFAIERTNDKVHLLDGGKINTTFDLKELGTDQAPVDSKAYVPLYNQSLIAILDLSEGKVSRRIDLNEFNAVGDSDHSAEVSEGVYDANNEIAYFLLQRIDIASYNGTPNLPCSSNPGLVVGIDTKTDEVVDLNGNAEGKAIELKLVNPRSLSINSDGTALYLLADGCYEGTDKVQQGVEVVDLTDGTTIVAYEAEGTQYLASLILTGGEDALIKSYDNGAPYGTHWTKLKLLGGTLGAELANVPAAVSFDGTDLLGVEVTDKVGKVVRYELATETSTTVSATSWVGEYSSASATALVQ
jgi:hypothetical protein